MPNVDGLICLLILVINLGSTSPFSIFIAVYFFDGFLFLFGFGIDVGAASAFGSACAGAGAGSGSGVAGSFKNISGFNHPFAKKSRAVSSSILASL
jgi:hypothetical protein